MPDVLNVQVKQQVGTFTLNVSFTIARWPAVLFGPSGAGKTMLLRIIAGLDRLNSASIRLGDQRLGPLGTEGVVQLVAQRPTLFPHLTVAQNVAFGLGRLSSTEQKSRVQEMLALLGAEQLADRMPVRLSGGERQRIAIARALATRPRLLLLDEAFTGLDSTARQDILSRLTILLAQEQVAALYVTHEVSDAFALDAEVVVLQQGRMVAQGAAQQALAEEKERLLASLGGVPTSGIASNH